MSGTGDALQHELRQDGCCALCDPSSFDQVVRPELTLPLPTQGQKSRRAAGWVWG